MGLPTGNWFLNSKEKKKLLQALNEQFGISELPEGVYLQNASGKISLLSRDIEEIPFRDLRIDTLGLYVAAWQADGLRLSIEGAQILAPFAKKNVIELDGERRKLWLKGEDVLWEADENSFVIVKYKDDILGCGKIRLPRDGKDERTVILNYIPKARRLVVVNE